MKFYCMEWNSNKNQPDIINILSVINPLEIKKMIKYKGDKPDKYNSIKNKTELKNYLDTQFRYYFQYKCEHEIIVNSWPYKDHETETKIDVYEQIKPNLDVITDYVCEELGIDFRRK